MDSNIEMVEVKPTTARLHVPKSRFHVKKIYSRLHQELVTHIEKGSTEVAANLIRGQQGELNHVDEIGVTLLMTACIHGNPLLVRTLIEEGAAVNAADNDQWTALMYACRDGKVEIVSQLLDSNADTERRDLGGWTALMWACYKGHADCAGEMIRRGANVNIKAMHNMTCLHWAAGRGHLGIVDLLLSNDAKVDSTDKYGSTPLIWACRKGFTGIVTALIALGASVDAVGMYSWTPLLLALQGGHIDVAKCILQHSPNLNATDKAGMTALALAAKGGYDDIVTELLDQGAYLNVLDKNGDTVLHHAVKGCHIDIVKVLLRKNPDIDAGGQDGKTVLHLAVEKGNTVLVKLLLSVDADKEVSDKDGNTPLLRAVRNRNCEMAAMLVEKGSRVAAADSKGDTSLHVAMKARNRKMLDVLLKNPKHSRYLYIRNHCGETPYNIDRGYKKSLLSHIFGARSLNSQNAVESQLGYELYSSALADILSSPTLNTPMSVGLFAKWGSGKSFLLNKLKVDMKAYMKHSPQVYFQFSWLVFIINFSLSLLIGLLLAGAVGWLVGLGVGSGLFVLLYVLQGILYCLNTKKNWEWVNHISHSVAKKLQKLRLLMYLFFYNRQPAALSDDADHSSISFIFAESTKLTSLGGEQSLSSMIGSLFDELEKKYGTCVTRLYKVFSSDNEQKGRFKSLCCIPYFVIVILVLACFVSGIGLIWSHPDIKKNPKEMNIVMAVLASIVAFSLLLSVRNVGRAIAAYAYSPKKCTLNASQSLDASKNDKFLHVLKNEVEFISSLVSTMDRHENWQTRMVLIVDGLDSCEQGKVLQVLDAINLIIPEDSPFIVLLALDPHIIIKGIEANQMQGMQEPGLSGYGYLKNLVHLPFYLQNHGLPRMYTANDNVHTNKWHGKQKAVVEARSSILSSSVSSQDHGRTAYQRFSSQLGESRLTMEPLHQLIGDVPKNIMKNDYFVDINPRSMRRLMNIIAMAGRLLRANDIDFDWYRLSAWINVTEQWPYRTSWILLYYEEMEGRLDESQSLLSIYQLVKERIPILREIEPLLDIDRNEKKFIAFLKSHVPKLDVDDIKKFMPSTINLDPFLRKIIKEKSRDTDILYHPDKTLPSPSSGVYFPPRFPVSQPRPHVFYNQMPTPWMEKQQQPLSAARKVKLPKGVKSLSRSTVSDICDLLHKIKGISSANINTYKAAILLHNISGVVLSTCDLPELKSVLEMKFGDWQLFQSTVLAMREEDTGSISTSNSSDTEILNQNSSYNAAPEADVATEAAVAPEAAAPPVTQDVAVSPARVSSLPKNSSTSQDYFAASPPTSTQGHSLTSTQDSSLTSLQSRLSFKLKGKTLVSVDTSEDTVRLENEMIRNVLDFVVPDASSDTEEDVDSVEDDDDQLTLRIDRESRTPFGLPPERAMVYTVVNETKAYSQEDGETVVLSTKSRVPMHGAEATSRQLPMTPLPVVPEISDVTVHQSASSFSHGSVNHAFSGD